jgi:hypothetical protein
MKRKARWEAHCHRCGLCCYEKEYRGKTLVTIYSRPCRYLDIGSKLCAVYESRFDACAQCRKMTVFRAIFVSWLPPSCGYVKRYRACGATGKRRLA